MGSGHAPAAICATLVLAVACSSDPPAPVTVPTRTFGLVVWHKPSSPEAHVEVVGDWNAWKRPGLKLEPRPHGVAGDEGWRVAAIDVPPGEHVYAIVEDGVWLTDANEPMTDLNKALFTFAAYNAGPAKVRQLRKEAEERGLSPNIWFGNVEQIASERIGRETVTYVANIFKYYVAYRLVLEEAERRAEAKAAVKAR